MRKFGITVLALSAICFLVTNASASPVGLPSGVKEMEGEIFTVEEDGIEVALITEVDFLNERKLDTLNSEAEAIFYTAKFVFSFEDKVDFYTFLGHVQDVKYKATISDSEVIYEFDDKFYWGFGINALIYDWLRYRVRFFGDVKYRRVRDIEYTSMTVDNLRYDTAEITTPKVDSDWDEWQIAFGVAKEFEHLMLYGGIKYSNVDLSAEATVGGTTYTLGSAESDRVIGPFIGCSFMPTDRFSVDLEGRFVDEQAVTLSAVIQF